MEPGGFNYLMRYGELPDKSTDNTTDISADDAEEPSFYYSAEYYITAKETSKVLGRKKSI